MHLSDRLRQVLYFQTKRLMGSTMGQRYHWLKRNQFLSRQDNEALQNHLLARLLESTYYRVPYYKKPFEACGLVNTAGQICLERFSCLPPLTRQDVIEHRESLLSLDHKSRGRIWNYFSGGTTGEPVINYGDQSYNDWCMAHTALYYDWMGLQPGMPYYYYWAAYKDLGQTDPVWYQKLWMETIQNRRVLNCCFLSEEIQAKHIEEINQSSHYKHMVAYVNQLYDLACFSNESGLLIKRPFEGILTTTGTLTPEMREMIETVFHCPVYSRYGSREIGDLACECVCQSGFHINPLYSKLEVANEHGAPVETGEEGRILVTCLHNSLMPLIRYENQDLGIQREAGLCRCGRQWQTLDKITGRMFEKIEFPDGSTFNNLFLSFVMDIFTELKRYQLVHVGGWEIEISLEARDPNYIEHHQAEVQESEKRLRLLIGERLKVHYKQVESVKISGSGKYLYIIPYKEPTEGLPMPYKESDEALSLN